MQPAALLHRNGSLNINGPLATSVPCGQNFGTDALNNNTFASDMPTMKSFNQSNSSILNPPSGPSHPSGLPTAPHASLKPEPLTARISFRQDSLEALASTELTRTKTLNGSQTLFIDVLEQLSSKEESLPIQAALYKLPSMQFLESLLDEMDSRSAHAGCPPPEPPLYLPIDSFDLPGLDSPGSQVNDITQLGLPPLPRRVHSANAAIGNNTYSQYGSQDQPVVRMRQPPPPFDAHTYMQMIPTAGSAAPSPQKGMPAPFRPGQATLAREAASALEELYGFEEPETSLQTSKSGRVRKVTSFTGGKRKHGDMVSLASAPAALAGEPASFVSRATYQESEMALSYDGSDDVSIDGKKSYTSISFPLGVKKGKKTVCLNCGSHQTPQWRCGPLGPRTLCNACGVRYKKGLPLNCWPLREGMVLPPGAVLPPTVTVPPGMNIITQPLESE